MRWPWKIFRKKKETIAEKETYKNVMTAKTEDGQIVNIGTMVNICLSCGEEVPEGTEICSKCESKIN